MNSVEGDSLPGLPNDSARLLADLPDVGIIVSDSLKERLRVLPNTAGEQLIIMSSEGYDLLQARMNLANDELLEISKRTGKATADGETWHDNAEFDEIQRLSGIVGRQIKDLREKHDRAVVIGLDDIDQSRISFGATVRVLEDDGEQLIYRILGPIESDNRRQILSYTSPLGAAILKGNVGNTVSIAREGIDSYKVKILDVSYVDFDD